MSNSAMHISNSNDVKINNMILTPLRKELYQAVLTNLYRTLNLSKIKYQMVTSHNNLLEIKNSPYYVTCHIHGYNYILFLTTIDGKPYNCLVAKKKLKYFLAQNVMSDMEIYTFKMKYVKPHFYQDTIFDGKIIKSESDDATFMIYDCYTLCSTDMYSIEMETKFNILSKVINELNVNIMQENMNIKIITLYNNNDIPKLFKNPPLKINGLIFLPKLSGKYFIYVNEEEFNKPKIFEKKQQIEGSIYEFLMKKTDIPDVYELYVETESETYKEGIAHIPNMHTSFYCVDLFKNTDEDMIKVKCIKSMKFNKWIPLCQDISELSTVLF